MIVRAPPEKGIVMRCLLVIVALFGFVSAASAGDFEPAITTSPAYAPTPFVPAPRIYRRWEGFYLGGEVGYGSANIDFSEATESLLSFMLRELALENEQHPSQWQVLGKTSTGGPSAGGFVGYNSQWDELIVGVELNYGSSRFSATAPATPIGRRVSAGGNIYDVTLNGSASMRIHDFGTARLRAGYIIDTIMPWAMIGLAAGRADITRSASVDGFENLASPCVSPPGGTCVPFSYSQSETRNNAWIYGWTAGVGIDAMIMPHVFVRAEYEYTSFFTVADIKANINTARVGAGFKF
jgi:opacity protein-like surface antigen